MGQSNYIHLEGCFIKKETDKAFLVSVPIDGEAEEHWLPKSQISNADNLEEGDSNVTVSITEFIANEKGLSEN